MCLARNNETESESNTERCSAYQWMCHMLTSAIVGSTKGSRFLSPPSHTLHTLAHVTQHALKIRHAQKKFTIPRISFNLIFLLRSYRAYTLMNMDSLTTHWDLKTAAPPADLTSFRVRPAMPAVSQKPFCERFTSQHGHPAQNVLWKKGVRVGACKISLLKQPSLGPK